METQDMLTGTSVPARRTGEGEAIVRTPESLKWVPDPNDPRRAAAMIVGDPSKEGPYTVQMRAPRGYAIGLHTHPTDDEQLTVLSGMVYWSSGDPGSGAPEYELRPGGVAITPRGMPHRLWATEDSVIQMTGIGPHTYEYLNPADDPRTKH